MEKTISTIVPTEHEKSEWSRMAQDCYGRDMNLYGHRYSVAATLRKGEAMRIDVFDGLQINYRVWLIDGAQALAADGVFCKNLLDRAPA